MAHSDAWEGKWRRNWWMEWIASTLHTPSEHGASSITTADVHTSAASSQLKWRPCRFKWTRPFCQKTKSGFCACAVTFQTQCTRSENSILLCVLHHNVCELQLYYAVASVRLYFVGMTQTHPFGVQIVPKIFFWRCCQSWTNFIHFFLIYHVLTVCSPTA